MLPNFHLSFGQLLDPGLMRSPLLRQQFKAFGFELLSRRQLRWLPLELDRPSSGFNHL